MNPLSSMSGQAEVFPLHMLLTCILLRLLVWVHDAPSLPRARLCSLMAGVALTNQHTSILFVVPFGVLLILYERRRLLNAKAVGSMAATTALGLSPYLGLIVMSWCSPIDSWGDLTSARGFLTHLLRREYGTLQLASSEIATQHSLLHRLSVYATHLFVETQLVFTLIALVGVFVAFFSPSFAQRRRVVATLLVSYLIYIGVFHYLANLDLTPFMLGVQMRFWMQPNLIVFIFAAIGWSRFRWLDAIAIAALISQTSSSWKIRDFSGSSPVLAYGESILASMPPNALVLLNGDLNNNIPKYLSVCEGRRPDLSLISLQLMSWEWFVPLQRRHHPSVVFPGTVYHPQNGFSMDDFLEANWDIRPIYLCGGWKEGDRSHETRYQLLIAGLCARVVREDAPLSRSDRMAVMSTAASSLPVLAPWDGERITQDLWESIVYRDTWYTRLQLFNQASELVSLDPHLPREELKIAAVLGRELFKDHTDGFQPEVWRNAGVVFGMYSVHDASFSACMLRAWELYVKHAAHPEENIVHLTLNRYNPYRSGQII